MDLRADLEAFAELTIELGPTVREFRDLRELSSTSVVMWHFQALERAGWIRRRSVEPHARGWVLTEAGREELRIDAEYRAADQRGA